MSELTPAGARIEATSVRVPEFVLQAKLFVVLPAPPRQSSHARRRSTMSAARAGLLAGAPSHRGAVCAERRAQMAAVRAERSLTVRKPSPSKSERW